MEMHPNRNLLVNKLWYTLLLYKLHPTIAEIHRRDQLLCKRLFQHRLPWTSAILMKVQTEIRFCESEASVNTQLAFVAKQCEQGSRLRVCLQ